MKRLLIIFTVLIFSFSLYAGDAARKGTTGAEQLLVPVGARGIATGGSMLATLTGLESIYYNPAGLARHDGAEAMFSYMSYLADINVSYFAASANLGDFGSMALSFKTFDFGDIPVTTVNLPDGTGETYSPTFLTVGLTYSKIVTDRISVGANFKLITEEIVNTTASGFAVDFGVQYRFSESLFLGASVKNIGSNMTYSGSDLQQSTEIPGTSPGSKTGLLEVVAEEFQIPSYFELSLAYKYDFNEQNRLIVASTFTNNNSFEDNLSLGLEYGFMNTFFLRGGYSFLTENSDESVFGFTAGAGVNYDFAGELGIAVDYAFRDVKEFPEPNHIFTVKLGF
ncbi:MAG: PorV/PorQ family protein [Melioribacteraceae bacterium]|nr:PorV/PorQ family protein [Melioribacteraceae bacterium]WKZ70527.1 MAG: PorV/PorQ family protein [Melioribacteraceae bacterium]